MKKILKDVNEIDSLITGTLFMSVKFNDNAIKYVSTSTFEFPAKFCECCFFDLCAIFKKNTTYKLAINVDRNERCTLIKNGQLRIKLRKKKLTSKKQKTF